ncbi:MAG TPA: winged helix-turn-helix domain-containing protein [Candidatus Binatia bacterium]|jgi:hypothetical protein|nr:winged helix-turn-helix domain-containing protein [Candidatus Binatia bacterium]
MTTVNWKEAIIKVLRDSSESLHYAEIADRVAKANPKYDLGATPANSVVAVISVSLKEDGPKSPFVRVARGYYALAPNNQSSTFQTSPEEELEEAGFINAFGMYWRRDSVHWVRTPKILGQQQPGSDSVNMASQKGVYLLHDGRSVVYVGQAIDQALGVRLSQHTFERTMGSFFLVWDLSS